MKVKLFASKEVVRARFGGRVQRWETEMNAWLQQNPQAKIAFIKQTATGGSVLSSQWLISVWYDDSPT